MIRDLIDRIERNKSNLDTNLEALKAEQGKITKTLERAELERAELLSQRLSKEEVKEWLEEMLKEVEKRFVERARADVARLASRKSGIRLFTLPDAENALVKVQLLRVALANLNEWGEIEYGPPGVQGEVKKIEGKIERLRGELAAVEEAIGGGG